MVTCPLDKHDNQSHPRLHEGTNYLLAYLPCTFILTAFSYYFLQVCRISCTNRRDIIMPTDGSSKADYSKLYIQT